MWSLANTQINDQLSCAHASFLTPLDISAILLHKHTQLIIIWFFLLIHINLRSIFRYRFIYGHLFGLKKLHPSTHLYTSDHIIKDWPGKIFEIRSIVKPNKKEIQKLFPDKKVNVVTRNYPLSASQLKSKLGLKDGGVDFLIGTTLSDNKKILLQCKLIG